MLERNPRCNKKIKNKKPQLNINDEFKTLSLFPGVVNAVVNVLVNAVNNSIILRDFIS